MRHAAPGREIEIKLRVLDVLALRRLLKRLRAREIVPRTYESNTLYDTAGRTLMRRGELIRIRIEQPASPGGKRRPGGGAAAILTYKGPVQDSPVLKRRGNRPKAAPRFKVRDEIEISLGDGGKMAEILRALGLRPVFRYEKFRTTYALPGIANLKVEMDETPVGVFLELEGGRAAIDRAARLLGYSRSEYLTQTYGVLYIADCRRRGTSPANMLFRATRNLP